jgi:hypothetical protein
MHIVYPQENSDYRQLAEGVLMHQMQLRIRQCSLDYVFAWGVKMELLKLIVIGKIWTDSNFASLSGRHFHNMTRVLHDERCITETEIDILQN